MSDRKKVIIVGAGMAGLTAAAYLSREDFDILLLDKNERCGGLLDTFEQDGFFFDAGPRAFVNSGMVKPMLKDLGIDWEFLENKISIGIEDHMFRVDTMDSLAQYKTMLEDLYPADSEDIGSITALIERLSRYTEILYEFDNPNFVDVMSDKKFIIKELLPWTFKFLNALRQMNKFNMPMEKFLKQLTGNQSLIDILLQLFFRKMPTYFALGYFYVYLDYFYPKGGTGSLPNLLKEKFLGGGGEIKLNTRIDKILPAESKIIDSDGNSYSYDRLIWAADLKTLYRNTDPRGLDGKAAEVFTRKKKSILSSKGAESVYILFIAADKPPSWFRERGGEHLFYTPSRKGLGEIHLSERENLLENFESRSIEDVLKWLDDYCEYNTFEISVPSLRDPSLSPEGQTGIMISCLFDYDITDKIEKAGWYDRFKEHLESKIISIVSRSLYENLNEDILFKFSSTPRTINSVSGSSEGAITGWSFETEIPVVDKLKNIPDSVLTAVPNVLQAGQWAYAPSGVPIAMLTGWYATQKILKDKKKNRIK